MKTASTIIPLPLASGQKAKARDILAAIRTLKQIEHEQRPPSADERQALSRFGGFGAVALHLFPDPVTGQSRSTRIRPSSSTTTPLDLAVRA